MIPQEKTLPVLPSMQGMGTSVVHIYEMVCQDMDGYILLLPAWPADKFLRIAMYSSLAGRVEIEYVPGGPVRLRTERDVKIKTMNDDMIVEHVRI